MDDEQPPAGIPADEWAATSPFMRQAFRVLLSIVAQQQQLIAQQQQQIAVLLTRVADLEARLNQNSRNSSKPPSSDPPSAPKQPSRPKGAAKRGAQKGHRPHLPEPPDHIDKTIDHFPDVCSSCSACVSELRQDACLPREQFVYGLPDVRPSVFRHRYHTVCCRGCGSLVTAARPNDVPSGSFDASVAAAIAVLRSEYRLSVRDIPRFLYDFFKLPLCTGTVINLQSDSSVAVAESVAEVETVVRKHHSNIDETSWYEAGKRRYLWVMATAVASLFRITTSRSGAVLRALLGDNYGGVVTSDRLKPYLGLDPERHQLCWAHLMRNFQAVYERGGAVGVWGEEFLAIGRLLFHLWHLYRDEVIKRDELQAAMEPVEAMMHALLEKGSRTVTAPEGMCQELLNHEAALWTFVNIEGVEPTNNAAEQALRPAVLWRKNSFGAHSAEGNLFVERMLTVSATCRKQKRHLRTFLTEAISAYWAGLPAPSLFSPSVPTHQ
jgi:transposase